MATILVTGGAGYIGSHTCKRLAAAGHLPVVADNLSRGHRWAVKWGPFEHGDVRDPTFLSEVILRWRPEAVIHFAGYALVGESVVAPQLYYANNVVGTLSLLEAMRLHGLDRIIFSSTCAVYGTTGEQAITEDQPCRPINPYGHSKLAVEHMLEAYAAAHGVHSVALRYFNAAGASPCGSIGERHDPETHIIPSAMTAALGLRPPLQLFGHDYPTPDGTCVRDYIHVEDLADAHLRAAEWLLREGGCSRFNLGTGTGYSIKRIIEAIETVAGRKVPAEFAPRRPGDPPTLVADAARASQVLGWRPQASDIENIVSTAWTWCIRDSARIAGSQ